MRSSATSSFGLSPRLMMQPQKPMVCASLRASRAFFASTGVGTRPGKPTLFTHQNSFLFQSPGVHLRFLSTAGSKGEAQQPGSIIQQIQKDEADAHMLPMTVAQKTKAGFKLSFWLGVVGLGLTTSYFIVRELMPTQLSPTHIFDNAFSAVKENPEVTMRLGSPVTGYGIDMGGRREGRRNFVAHD